MVYDVLMIGRDNSIAFVDEDGTAAVSLENQLEVRGSVLSTLLVLVIDSPHYIQLTAIYT